MIIMHIPGDWLGWAIIAIIKEAFKRFIGRRI